MENKERMSRRSELEYQKVARRMRTAIQIADAMEKNGISKKQLADMMGRRPSEITKWLSGDQNFTLDTLTELSFYLKEKITGETVVITKSYISVSYNPMAEQSFPENKTISRITIRPKWSNSRPVNQMISQTFANYGARY